MSPPPDFPGRTGGDEALSGLIRVDIARICPYARNPRRQPNPESLRIKASIRAEGLDQPLVVTQEPGREDYVLHTGGNTRLQILKELFEETGEARYGQVECILRPWTRESSVLLAHLRENELRGNLPFIDRALAVFEAKSMLEHERSIECLSHRQLEHILHEQGFGLSRGMLSRMSYAVEVLWPVMPKALGGGLGRPQVERIRGLERAACEVWLHLGAGDADQFRQVFGELCRRYDDVEWDLDLLRTALENELAVESDLDPRILYFALEVRLAGQPVDGLIDQARACLREDAEFDAGLEAEQEAGPGYGEDPVHEHEAVHGIGSSGSWTQEEADASASESEAGSAAGVAQDAVHEIGPGPGDPAEPVPGPAPRECTGELASLRASHHACAMRLAEHHGLEDRVIALPDQGLGFLLTGFPCRELSERPDAGEWHRVCALWWQLAACCELTAAPEACVLSYLDKTSFLYQTLARREYLRLDERVWTPDPARLIAKLGRDLDEGDWSLLVQMTGICRSLGCHARETGQPLWRQQGGQG